MKQDGIYHKAERLIGVAFQDATYRVGDMHDILHAIKRRGGNVQALMVKSPHRCPCTCEECQVLWLKNVCQKHRDGAKRRDILCTGSGKDREWFYLDGMRYEASLPNGRMTFQDVLEYLLRVRSSMVKLHRQNKAAIKALDEAIKELQQGMLFAVPELLKQDTLFDAPVTNSRGPVGRTGHQSDAGYLTF